LHFIDTIPHLNLSLLSVYSDECHDRLLLVFASASRDSFLLGPAVLFTKKPISFLLIGDAHKNVYRRGFTEGRPHLKVFFLGKNAYV